MSTTLRWLSGFAASSLLACAPDADVVQPAGDGGAASEASASDAGIVPAQDASWTPPQCGSGPPKAGLPPTAPKLEAGKWTVLKVAGLAFQGEPASGNFAQGFALDPCNPATMYVCIENFPVNAEAGFYKSTDAGTTWTKVGKIVDRNGKATFIDHPIRVRVDPKDPKHLYVGDGVRGGTQGFWVSHDGGETFETPKAWIDLQQQTGFYLDDVYDIAVDPTSFDHVLISSHSPLSWNDPKYPNAGIVESKDGGQSWVVHQPTTAWGYGHGVWFLGSPSTWLVGTQGDGFWRTTNSGGTWTQVSKASIFHGGGQVLRAKNALFAASDQGVIRSTDDGVTWTSAGGPPSINGLGTDGSNFYAHTGYAGGVAPFSTSTDGTNWTATAAAGTFSNGPFEVVFDEANRILYSANWGNGVLALKVP